MANHNYNCAETMLNAANEVYGIGLNRTATSVAAGFGGGLGKERACGALTGGMMALGCLFARDRSHLDPRMTEIRDAYVSAFESHFGSTECSSIKQSHRDPSTGCHPVVSAAAVILEEIVDRYANDGSAK